MHDIVFLIIILYTLCNYNYFWLPSYNILVTKVLRSVVKPSSLDDKSFKEVTSILVRHYDPAMSTIIPYNFHTREHGLSESIGTYVAELKSIVEHCDFENTQHKMIHDRLLCKAGFRGAFYKNPG